ncbi:sigma-54-dependent Fis family transcriptional regulator, partial [Candidatus Peregrinibacteria bacterium]|nr:sigma-54-dependent Fis family transcriptional regulator [Candidatus Peregrinibacteria bacterium]
VPLAYLLQVPDFRHGQYVYRSCSEHGKSICARRGNRELRRGAGLVVEGDTPESTSGIAAAWEQGIFGSNSRRIINILITGESGTGKEPMARAIANLINDGRNVQAISCATIAPTLAESDLFGHEQGAFTDAKKQRIGLFEAANDNGIVHLDEIGHLALDIQAKLLRLLDDPYTFRRVGGGAEVRFTGRAVIATTSDDLEVKAQRNDFNRALLNRLSSIHLTLPTLEERPKEHWLALIDHFLCKLSAEYENTITMTDDAIATLLTMTFPSNIRGLRDMITKAYLCMQMDEGSTCIHRRHIRPASRAQEQDMPNCQVDGTISALKKIRQRDEKAIIYAVLESEKWRRKHTAIRLGISRTTLYKKMRQYKLLDAETVDGVRD